jgi:hypothetical protein
MRCCVVVALGEHFYPLLVTRIRPSFISPETVKMICRHVFTLGPCLFDLLTHCVLRHESSQFGSDALGPP